MKRWYEVLDEAKLCYISGNCAYFTTAPKDKQWGDGWGKIPFEHNSGEPYKDCRDENKVKIECQIIKIYFEGEFIRPDDNCCNSLWCMDAINKGCGQQIGQNMMCQ